MQNYGETGSADTEARSYGLKDTDVISEDAETVDPETDDTENTGMEEDRRRGRGRLKFIAAFAAGFAACLAVFAIVTYGAHLGRFIPEADYDYFTDLSEKYGKYYVIMKMIGEDPLVDKAPEAYTDETLKELVESLDDPYAEYFTKAEYEEFTRMFMGDYSGIGILVGANEDGLLVEQVYPDGPADTAGMKAGDYIIRVDGTVPSDLDDAVSRMTGEAGTDVTVTVMRGGKELDLEMTREPINIDSVIYSAAPQDPGIGYIQITSFTDDTDEEFKEAVSELKKDGCDRFILDLRSNGGGLTDVSIEIADYLLPACKIMTEVNKDGSEKVYSSKESSADLDLVILVDQNTASASEILTAALRENNAGTVIGTKTYGKGVTQVTRQFKDGSAIKLTITEYLTPKGHHVQDKGITPDIEAGEDDIMEKAIEELNK